MVTDDSDAFAFGGRAVYKNIFNDRKFVEVYLLPDAEKVSFVRLLCVSFTSVFLARSPAFFVEYGARGDRLRRARGVGTASDCSMSSASDFPKLERTIEESPRRYGADKGGATHVVDIVLES